MAEVERYAKDLLELGRLAKEFKTSVNSACGGSFDWGMKEVGESYLSMFDRFCPHDVGDRVELTKNVPVEQSSGWYPSRHFLIQGGKGTIQSRGYRDGKFSFDVEFDDETWIDSNGDEQEVSLKHVYGLNETYLRRTKK